MSKAADEARRLASLFHEMARSVNGYRTQHFNDLTPDDRARLDASIQSLDNIHDEFTGTAIQATLDGIQSDLDRITSVTTQAQQSLKHLTTVAEIASLASAAAELGMGIVSGDYGTIAEAIDKTVRMAG